MPADYNVVVSKNTTDGEKRFFHKIGVAFRNDKGAIQIVLNPCTVIDWRTLGDHTLTLYPHGYRDMHRKSTRWDSPAIPTDHPDDYGDDDIPF